MTEEIIERLEEYLGSEEFEYEAENCMEELDESGEGINAVLPLLRFLERHPMADISMTSAVVRYMEQFYGRGYDSHGLRSSQTYSAYCENVRQAQKCRHR